jgi:hypothetical protein
MAFRRNPPLGWSDFLITDENDNSSARIRQGPRVTLLKSQIAQGCMIVGAATPTDMLLAPQRISADVSYWARAMSVFWRNLLQNYFGPWREEQFSKSSLE